MTASPPPVLAAAVQFCSTADRAANRRRAHEGIRRAAGLGATLIVLPEMCPFIGPDAEKIAGAEGLEGPIATDLSGLAAELGIWLVGGSIPERAPGGRVHNTAVAFDPSGRLVAAYRKIHLFDAAVPGASFTESDSVAPGGRAVAFDCPWGRVGLAICYDLRFPELFAALRRAGATILAVPSAFTARTGKDHWEVLVRARAIETQCWVIAAEQWGHHDARRESHGHSMIVDPWGHVVARCGDGDGLAIALLDPARTEAVRAGLPVASHRRAFEAPGAG